MLAEYSGRTAHPAEVDLSQGKATDEAACDMELSRMLEALPALSPAELRSEWRRLYRSQPPRLSRDLLDSRHRLPYPGASLWWAQQSDQTEARRARECAAVRGGDSTRGRPEDQSGRAVGARMERPYAHRHGAGGRLHLCRTELPLADRNRSRNHGRPLVGPAFLRTGQTTNSQRLAPSSAGWAWKGAFRMPSRAADGTRKSRQKVRCAIYTRKSTEEGLEQDFNSLDAQREACEAFILSQKHEGWVALPALYDDGGYSGGTMQRPALQRLLADIAAGGGGYHRRLQG